MDAISLKTASATLLSGFLSLLFLHYLHKRSQHPQEPPLAPSTMPYLSHILGLYSRSFNYYTDLNKRAPVPISTMLLPFQKIYVVNSPHLIQLIQKQPKTLSFRPIEAKLSAAVCGLSKKAYQIMMDNVNGTDGNWGISAELYPIFKETLKPGGGLDGLNRYMIRVVADALDSLEEWIVRERRRTVMLNEWIREVITEATTDSVYGPESPFRKPGIREAFWYFEKEFMIILMGVMPSILARKGLAARDKVAKAFLEYFQNDGQKRARLCLNSILLYIKDMKQTLKI